jgi:hypothetical protein
LVLFLLAGAAAGSCEPEKPPKKETPPPPPLRDARVEFAPGITHLDDLAFIVRSQADSVLCREILVDTKEGKQTVWKADTKGSAELACPKPLWWGQGFEAGWRVPGLCPRTRFIASK